MGGERQTIAANGIRTLNHQTRSYAIPALNFSVLRSEGCKIHLIFNFASCRGLLCNKNDSKLKAAGPSCRAIEGVGLQPLAC
jgi:hypothetical protein